MQIDWFDEHPQVWEWLIVKPVAILTLIVVAVVVRWVLFRLIDRLVRRATEATVPGTLQRGRNGGETRRVGQRREQRSRTLGSLLKSITTSVIGVVVALMIISQLGYNIAPLIASAGIIGLAIGFGAQALVQDYLSGIFMMLEDQYGVGDIVDLGEAVGEIESVGLRITRIRDVDGTVWYVRNGEILRVGNMSQHWSRTVLDVAVGYDSDLTHVREQLADVARQLHADPAFRPVVLEEPEVWGVQSLDRDAVLVRIAIKTAPMQQWGVAREMRQRIKERFDQEGIHMPNWPAIFLRTGEFAGSRDPSTKMHQEPG